MGLVVLLMLFAASWLLLIRPQQQRLRAQRALIDSLEVGDRVVTAGGIIGTVTGLTDRDAEVEVAPGVTLTFLRAAMSRRLVDGNGDATADVDVVNGDGVEEEGA